MNKWSCTLIITTYNIVIKRKFIPLTQIFIIQKHKKMISDDNLLIHNYHLIITIFSFTLLFGDKLHRASYCHNKLLHLILLPSAPLPSLWPKSPESEQGVQDSIHWQPCFLQVQTGHSVSSAMRARYKSVWTDARTDSSLTSLTCTLYYTATTFMSVSVICTSMEDGMFSPREWQR